MHALIDIELTWKEKSKETDNALTHGDIPQG